MVSRVPLFGQPQDGLKPRISPFGGNEPPLGLSLSWGSQKVEPDGVCLFVKWHKPALDQAAPQNSRGLSGS